MNISLRRPMRISPSWVTLQLGSMSVSFGKGVRYTFRASTPVYAAMNAGMSTSDEARLACPTFVENGRPALGLSVANPPEGYVVPA